MALSSDNNLLYISYADGWIRRLNLISNTFDLEFNLGTDLFDTQNYRADSMVVDPDNPDIVTIGQVLGFDWPIPSRVARFANGLLLTHSVDSFNKLAQGTMANKVYAYSDVDQTKLRLGELIRSSDGIDFDRESSILIGFADTKMIYAKDRLFFSTGEVASAISLTPLGTYGSVIHRLGTNIIPDELNNRVFYFIPSDSSDNGAIIGDGLLQTEIYDLESFVKLHSLHVRGIRGRIHRIIQLSSNLFIGVSYVLDVTIVERHTYLLKLVEAQVPVAHAGLDRTLNPLHNDPVMLAGDVTLDPQSTLTKVTWTQTGGPQVNLFASNTLTPTFTYDNLGIYTFTLSVEDSLGQISAPDTTVITISAPLNTFLPTAVRDFVVPTCLPARLIDFNQPVKEMPAGPGPGDSVFVYSYGSFAILGNKYNQVAGASPDWGIPNDATLSVDLRLSPSQPTERGGLVFNLDYPQGFLLWKDFYAFTISPISQTYYLEKWDAIHNIPTLLASGKSTAIRNNLALTQTLEVRHTANMSSLFVNGVLVKAIATEAYDHRTSVGLISVNNFRAMGVTFFDNLQASVHATNECIQSPIDTGIPPNRFGFRETSFFEMSRPDYELARLN